MAGFSRSGTDQDDPDAPHTSDVLSPARRMNRLQEYFVLIDVWYLNIVKPIILSRQWGL